MTLTSCVNCGAPLRGKKCEYCGTSYEKEGKFSGSLLSNPIDWNATGIFELDGVQYTCCLDDIEVHEIGSQYVGRDILGNCYRDKPIYKHKFTLVEV